MNGTIIGVRKVEGTSKTSGKPFKMWNLCIKRDKASIQDGFNGQQVDAIDVFENALGSFDPQPGDGVRYALFFQNGRQRCGFVVPDPDFDEGA